MFDKNASSNWSMLQWLLQVYIYCKYQRKSLLRNEKHQHPSHKTPPSLLEDMQARSTKCTNRTL